MEVNEDSSTLSATENSNGRVSPSTQQGSAEKREEHDLAPNCDGTGLHLQSGSVKDSSPEPSSQPDIFEKLYVEKTVSDESLKYGNTGESRRQMVERQRLEKEREEEAALSFKPLLIAKPHKKTNTTLVHKKEVFVDKELTFSPQITEKGKLIERPKNPKAKAEILFSSPGAGRTREIIVRSESFTPEITKVAKRLPADDTKLKGGPRLYAKSQSRELERQHSTPIKTKEEMECTFAPVFESKASFTRGNGKRTPPVKKPIKSKEEMECTFTPVFESRAPFVRKSKSKIDADNTSTSGSISSGGSISTSGSTSRSLTNSAPPSKPSGRRVLVVGSSNMDLISYVQEHPPIGATITGLSFEKKYGGKGANQAVMVARLCRPTPRLPSSTGVSFLTKVGSDIYGQDYLSYLRAEKGFHSSEGLLCCQDGAVSTGVALITVDEAGRNTIIIQPGANLELQPAEVTSFIAHQAHYANVLVCQNEISHQATLQALAEVSGIDHMVSIFNPAPISSNLENMFELLRYADLICPNEVELSLLAGMPVTSEAEAVVAGRHVLEKCRNLRKLVHFMTREPSTSGSSSVPSLGGGLEEREEDAGAAARRPQVMVVTLGSQGACIISDSGSEMLPAPKVHSIDTVGAGDCFIGTLAYHISNGVNLKQSVKYAVECASISVTRKGAQTSYPEISELNYSYKVSNSADSLENLDLS